MDIKHAENIDMEVDAINMPFEYNSLRALDSSIVFIIYPPNLFLMN